MSFLRKIRKVAGKITKEIGDAIYIYSVRDRGDFEVVDGLCSFCAGFNLIFDLDQATHLFTENEAGPSRIIRRRYVDLSDSDSDSDLGPPLNIQIPMRPCRIPLIKPIKDRYPDFPTLSITSARGCMFCRLLRMALKEKIAILGVNKFLGDQRASHKIPSTDDIIVDIVDVFFNVTKPSTDTGHGHAPVSPDYKTDLRLDIPIYLLQYDSRMAKSLSFRIRALDDVAGDYFGLQPHTELLTDDIVCRILGSVSDCLMQHPEGSCPRNAAYGSNDKIVPQESNHDDPRSTFVPKRLLFVGGTPHYPEPFLVNTTKLPSLRSSDDADPRHDLRYIAYSHCWGSPGRLPLMTTPETLQERMSRIPFHTLPRSFQDLALVARKLGVRYVWIDSLCIVQGPQGDFFEQASLMGDIYMNALLTVIGAGAPSAHTGFLKSGATAQLPYRIRELDATGRFALERAETASGENILHTDQVLRSLNEESPWAERGWTCQEELLSPRKLYFFPNRMLYACGKSAWCDRGTKSSKELDIPGFSEVAEDYAARTFTKFEDRFAAFAGIARWVYPTPFSAIGDITEDTPDGNSPVGGDCCRRNYLISESMDGYKLTSPSLQSDLEDTGFLAGINVHLVYTLLWANHLPPTEGHTTESGITDGPSFSWLSVIAPVSFELQVESRLLNYIPGDTCHSLKVRAFGQALPETHPGASIFDPFVHGTGSYIHGMGTVCLVKKIRYVGVTGGTNDPGSRLWAWQCSDRDLVMELHITFDWRGSAIESKDSFVNADKHYYCLSIRKPRDVKGFWWGLLLEELETDDSQSSVMVKSLVRGDLGPYSGLSEVPKKVFRRRGIFKARNKLISRYKTGNHSFDTMPHVKQVEFVVI